MDSTDGHSQKSLKGVKGGTVWSLLALAMAAGYLTVRYRPRVGAWLGLGCAALGCWKNCRPAATGSREEEACEEARDSAQPMPEALPPRATVGTQLLEVEPLPSLVEEATRGVVADGQAGSLLDQEPLLAFEESFSMLEAGIWPGQGAEIPDAVELPELSDSPGLNPDAHLPRTQG